MERRFLIDANLPYYFSLWNTNEFVHQKDIDDAWSDEQIWNYAKENDLTIISKDGDFSNRILFHSPPPKVIHIRFGNLKFKEFFKVLSKSWVSVVELNARFKLVNVFKDHVEGIS